MRSPSSRLILALVLLAAAAALWQFARLEHARADAERRVVTLRYEALDGTPDLDVAARYWAGDFAAVPPGDTLLAANAAFRDARAQADTWQSLVARLDEVAQRYADVLRAAPGNETAAYNYEYVVRLRQAVAATQPRGVATAGLPEGKTLHGDVGAPPEGSDLKQFKMIVPMRPDERQDAESAGRAGPRTRKG